MKKQNFFALLFILVSLFSYNNVSAQQNVVKLGLGSLVAHQNLNLKYERAFAERHSLQVSLIYDIPSSGGMLKSLSEALPNKVTKSGFFAVPEYRYYFGKKGSLRGFYGGAYAKIGRTQLKMNDVLVSNKNIPTDFNVRANTLGLGLNIGAQWFLSDHITLDWNIGGIGFARHAISTGFKSDEKLVYSKEEIISNIREELSTVEGTTVEALDQLVDDIEPFIDDVDTDNYQTASAPIGLLDLRFGLSIGYAF